MSVCMKEFEAYFLLWILIMYSYQTMSLYTVVLFKDESTECENNKNVVIVAHKDKVFN